MTSSKLGFVSVFALVSLSALAFAAACGERQFDGGDDDSQGNGGAGGEGSSSGGSGNTSGELRIGGELRDARFNVAYRAALEIEGEEGDVEFELTDGDLPRGVALSSDGVLSGKPSEEGVFDFTVVARDAAGNTGSVDLSLEVTRKRWLSYVARESASDQPHLYVVDMSKAQLPKTLLSGGSNDEFVEPGDYGFSADGSRLAFALNNEDGGKSLFVVDMSSDRPGEPVLVHTTGDSLRTRSFALTPNGDGLAFHAEVSSNTWHLFYVKLDEVPSEPDLVDDSSGGSLTTWVTNDRVVYDTKGGSNAWRVHGKDTFSAAQPINFGSLERVHRASQRVLLTQETAGCAKGGWLYDFLDNGRESSAPAAVDYKWPTYDSELRRVAHADGNGGMFVFDAMKTDGEPLGLVSPSRACEQVFWSPDAASVVMPNEDSPARLLLSTIANKSFVTREIPGNYGVFNSKQAGYAQTDRFLFAAENVIYESNFEDDEPSEARAIHVPADAALETIEHFSIAPDGSWVFFFGEQSIPTAGSNGAYAIHLGDDEPHAPRVLTSSTTLEIEVGTTRNFERPSSGIAWSADSSRLAYVTRVSASSPYVTRLYLADMLHDTAPAVGLTTGGCSGTPVQCAGVSSFLFQP